MAGTISDTSRPKATEARRPGPRLALRRRKTSKEARLGLYIARVPNCGHPVVQAAEVTGRNAQVTVDEKLRSCGAVNGAAIGAGANASARFIRDAGHHTARLGQAGRDRNSACSGPLICRVS